MKHKDNEPWLQALEQVATVQILVERNIDKLPPEGQDFANICFSKVSAIGETIREKRRLTEPQSVAICNLHRGLERWIKNIPKK